MHFKGKGRAFGRQKGVTMTSQMDGYHGDEEWLSAEEVKRSLRNEDDNYERWISERYFLHKLNKQQELKNEQDI